MSHWDCEQSPLWCIMHAAESGWTCDSPGQQEGALADNLREGGVVVHCHACAKQVVGVVVTRSVCVCCREAQYTQRGTVHRSVH
jgi:hypothetical protein